MRMTDSFKNNYLQIDRFHQDIGKVEEKISNREKDTNTDIFYIDCDYNYDTKQCAISALVQTFQLDNNKNKLNLGVYRVLLAMGQSGVSSTVELLLTPVSPTERLTDDQITKKETVLYRNLNRDLNRNIGTLAKPYLQDNNPTNAIMILLDDLNGAPFRASDNLRWLGIFRSDLETLFPKLPNNEEDMEIYYGNILGAYQSMRSPKE